MYHLASVENAWDYLDNKVVIGDKRWTSYVNCVLEIISEPDPVFNFPQEQQDYAGLLPGGKPFWTGTLKEGLLRSFIMKAYYKKDVNSQKEIDRVVEKLLTEIKTLNQWLSIVKRPKYQYNKTKAEKFSDFRRKSGWHYSYRK